VVVDDITPPVKSALPFPSRRRETLDIEGVRAAASKTLPFAIENKTPSSTPEDTASYRALEPRADPLPFASVRPVAQPPSVPPPFESWPPVAPSSPPPAPEKPAAQPRDEPPEADTLLPLQIYAQIKVALMLHGRPLDEVLKEHKLDAITWRLEERRRAEALSRAADRGDLGPIRELRRAMRQASQGTR
jgi:hypothetical protein